MAYRFNSGYGGVTCDVCNVLIDSGLSPDEYSDVYGSGDDYCWKHKPVKGKRKGVKIRLGGGDNESTGNKR